MKDYAATGFQKTSHASYSVVHLHSIVQANDKKVTNTKMKFKLLHCN